MWFSGQPGLRTLLSLGFSEGGGAGQHIHQGSAEKQNQDEIIIYVYVIVRERERERGIIHTCSRVLEQSPSLGTLDTAPNTCSGRGHAPRSSLWVTFRGACVSKLMARRLQSSSKPVRGCSHQVAGHSAFFLLDSPFYSLRGSPHPELPLPILFLGCGWGVKAEGPWSSPAGGTAPS